MTEDGDAFMAQAQLMASAVDSAYQENQSDGSGTLAADIPELALADPRAFGIALCAVDGRLYQAGDAEREFSLQGLARPFAFCLALELYGRSKVLARVGAQPLAKAPDPGVLGLADGLAPNPLMEVGGVAVCAMLVEAAGEGAYELLQQRFSEAAGRSLPLSETTRRSLAAHAHRSHAAAHLLAAAGLLTVPVEAVLDLYLRQSSLLASAVDLARMGATLANLGENPLSGEQAFNVSAVRDTLTVMLACGMQQASGRWALDVGMPVASGAAGGIVGAVNRQLGAGACSPRLDRDGHSVRGAKALAYLSSELGLHAFEWNNPGAQLLSGFG